MNLNQEQQAVVSEFDGVRCVLAGPGSGKSTTMVALIRQIMNSGVSATQIRAVTFSSKMAETLAAKIGIDGIASTFHSLGYAICSDGDRKPVEPEARYRLMCKLIKTWKLDYHEFDQFIAKMRREGLSPQQTLDHGEYDYGLCRAYAMYEKTRAEEGWMDFSSMLADALVLLEKPEVRARWSPRYIIADEVQDTSSDQWRMLQLMAKKHGNITVVGDPGQCQPAGTLVKKVVSPSAWGIAGICEQTPIESLRDGDLVSSWTKEDQRVYGCGRRIKIASRPYRGRILQITSNHHTTKVTPDHWLWARFSKHAFADKTHFVYLMWKDGLGFRVGTSHFRRTGKTEGRSNQLTSRGRQEKANKLWVLSLAKNRIDAETQEEIVSLTYGIPECVFHPYNGVKKSEEQIRRVFSAANPIGGTKCLEDYGLLWNSPLAEWPAKKPQAFHGYWKTAACNLIPDIMELPTEEPNRSAPISGIKVEQYEGLVYSLDVEKDHTYIADGIPVGNCIYSFRGAEPDNLINFQKWFPNGKTYYLGKNYRSSRRIVKFVRENTPPGTPQELRDRMIAAREDEGERIGLKMYWQIEDEAEAALTLAQKDPFNSIILARTNHVIGVLERICNDSQHKIRYHLLGKTSFWKQAEIQKAIEAMKPYASSTTEAAMNLALPAVEHKYAVDDRTERDNDALANLKTLRSIGGKYKQAQEFLAYANKMIHRRNDPKGVTLSTVHQAKGLEFRNVFIIGVHAEGFPHAKGEPLEEARIYYVAISRAIDYLRISFSGTPSPYLRKYLTDPILDALREKAGEVERLQTQGGLFA